MWGGPRLRGPFGSIADPGDAQQWFRERREEGLRQGSMVASPRAGSRPSRPEPCPQLVPQCRLVLASPQVFLGWGSGGGADVDPDAGFRGLQRPFGGSFLVRKGRPVLFKFALLPLLPPSRDSSRMSLKVARILLGAPDCLT